MAGDYLRELLTYLGFDLNETGFKRAEGHFKSLVALSAELTTRAVDLGTKLFSIATEAANAGDELRDTARALGITVEELQEFGFAGQQSGVAFEDLKVALRNLQREMDEARHGGKDAAKTFARLGGGVLGLIQHGARMPEVFQAIADRIAGIKDPAARTGLALRTFGKSGQVLIPLLLEGSAGIEAMRKRAEELGVVTTDQADASDEFNDSLGELARATDMAKKKLGFALLPVLKKVIERALAFYVANKKLVDRGINKLAAAVEFVVDMLFSLIEVLRGLDDAFPVLSLLAGLASGLVKVGRAIADAKPFLIAFAAGMTVYFLPAIAAGIVSAAKFAAAWLVAAAPILAVVAAFALVALVIDDVYAYASGGESLIGELFDTFLTPPLDPNAHWLVKTFHFILWLIKSALDGIDDFFKWFFDLAFQEGGILGAFEKIFDMVYEAAKAKFSELFSWIGEAISEKAKGVGAMLLRGGGKWFGSDDDPPITKDNVSNAVGAALGVAVPGQAPVPRTRGAPIASGSGAFPPPSIDARSRFEIRVDGAKDPKVSAEEVGKVVDQKMAQRNRELAERTQKRGVR